MTGPSALTVLCCRPDPAAATPPTGAFGSATAGSAATGSPAAEAAITAIAAEFTGTGVHWVGRRPGKPIDPLLAGRLLVVGDDADLAAVVLRLLRRELLEAVEVAYAAATGRTAFTELWQLPRGDGALATARTGTAAAVPLVRDDVGGVLLACGELAPVDGVIYVDADRVLGGRAERVTVRPDRAKGLAVTVTQRRLGGLRLTSATTLGRAVQFGITPSTVVSDGVEYPRPMDRWTFYLHTAPLLLVGASASDRPG